MGARDRLRAANVQRTVDRKMAEAAAITAASSNVAGVVTSNTVSGVTLETENGGNITIPRQPNSPGGLTPTVGGIYQVSTAGGARTWLKANTRTPQQNPRQIAQPGRTLFFLRAPVNGQDIGAPGDIWVHNQGEISGYDICSYWRWIQQLGRWAAIGGGTTVAGGQVQSPSNGLVICQIASADADYVVAELVAKEPGGASGTPVNTTGSTVFSGSGSTLQSNAAVGETINKGGSLEITVNTSGSTAVCWSITLVII